MPKPEKSANKKTNAQAGASQTGSAKDDPKRTKQSATQSKNVMNPHNSMTSVKYEDIHFVDSTKTVWNYSLFSDEDISNFQRGTHYNLYSLFGSRPARVLDTNGYYFAVWAPNASYISVKGNFNNWNNESHPLFVRLDNSGIWEGFIPHLKKGEVYKYHIHGYQGSRQDKGDPFAWFWEKRPATASI
ncbi:MAG TPA: hypothetical protein PLL71_10450, partial [Agriterribacter sp.]|nr:hypothetical protein [Agriterribacter sp.]